MGSKIQLGVMRAQKREIKISRLINSFVASVKKYTFRGFLMELKVFFAFIQQIQMKTFIKSYE
jgi:hypothetical protein